MEAEIKIYQSCWKNLWLILGCMLFTVGGIYMITDESCRLVNKIIGGWLGVIFFGGGGLWLAVTTLYNAVKRIPYLVIYKTGWSNMCNGKQRVTPFILQMYRGSD